MKIKLMIPRLQGSNYYSGDADKYLNLPIVINEIPVGVITKIIKDDFHFIEVEGYLRKAYSSYFTEVNDTEIPASVEITY